MSIPPVVTPTPIPTEPGTQIIYVKTESEDKIHYDSLIKYLKWALGITGTCILVITGYILFSTHDNIEKMKESIKSDMSESKTDYKSTISNLKKEISDLQGDAKSAVKGVKDESYSAIKDTRDFSQSELSKITISANELAMTETKKQIDYTFSTDKIQNLIENQAVKEVKGKVKDMVNDASKSILRITEAEIKMRVGLYNGMLRLKYFFEHPNNNEDSTAARNLYEDICTDYLTTSNGYYSDSAIRSSYEIAMKSKFIPIHIIDNKMPSDENEKKLLDKLINYISRQNIDLNELAFYITALRECTKGYTKVYFQPFNISEINAWYKSLTK